MTRTYVIPCPSCRGTGQAQHDYISTAVQKCPACQGTKVVLCTESDGTFTVNGKYTTIANTNTDRSKQ